MARIQMLAPENRTPEQAAACAEVIQGRRGKIPTPMIGWLRNPELARRLQKVGELLRFETTLEPRLVELAIIVCARHWTSHVEWQAHKALGLEAGLDVDIVDAIARRSEPLFSDERQRVVYQVVLSMLQTGSVPDALYAQAIQCFDERGVAELVGIAGYYTLVSFTLNMFELGLPESAAPELNDPKFPGVVHANPA